MTKHREFYNSLVLIYLTEIIGLRHTVIYRAYLLLRKAKIKKVECLKRSMLSKRSVREVFINKDRRGAAFDTR